MGRQPSTTTRDVGLNYCRRMPTARQRRQQLQPFPTAVVLAPGGEEGHERSPRTETWVQHNPSLSTEEKAPRSGTTCPHISQDGTHQPLTHRSSPRTHAPGPNSSRRAANHEPATPRPRQAKGNAPAGRRSPSLQRPTQAAAPSLK